MCCWPVWHLVVNFNTDEDFRHCRNNIYYYIVILQESKRIFTNNYKKYVPGFENLCNDKKLKDILNVHPKCHETCIDVATEEICKFIKNVCNAIWIFNNVI